MNKELCNFIETNGSFSILIQLMKYKDRRAVVFLPTVTFANIDKEVLENINRMFGQDKSITEYQQKGRKKKTYKIIFQGVEESNWVMDHISDCKINNRSRNEVIKLFSEGIKEITSIGGYHTVWNDSFEEIIDIKRKINKAKRTREGFSAEEWEEKIKEHLGGEIDG